VDELIFFQEHTEAILKMCQRSTRGTGCSCEEALSECWIRLPQVIATWRADRGASLKTHVMTGLRFYLFKLAGLGGGGRAERTERRRVERYAAEMLLRHPTRSGESDSSQVFADDELADSRRVQYIISRLGEDDATILCLRYCDGYSLDDLADYYEIGRTTAYSKLKRALAAAREVARTMPDDEAPDER
jgi:RNA polymerase sigma factor (sigma-70 family)